LIALLLVTVTEKQRIKMVDGAAEIYFAA